MNISSAQYSSDRKDNIIIVIDGITSNVPVCEDNMHYVEIHRQVKEGTLTIKDAE